MRAPETWAQMRQRHRRELEAAITALAAAGCSRIEAARALDMTPAALWDQCRAFGISWPKSATLRRQADERRHAARYALFRAGVSLPAAARQLGLAEVSLRDWAARRGARWSKSGPAGRL
jgi:transcriptional regulator with GAF, ATPase, and Fis domain